MFCKVLNCRNFLFFSFFFTFLFTTGCSKIDDGAIKIGHVAPLTGNQAHLGKDNEAGHVLRVAMIFGLLGLALCGMIINY